MADIHDKKTRSYNMSQIKGKDTKPEKIVRKFLFSKGLRYKLHDKTLPGKPDIVLPKFKTVVFVHGCFWHGHNGCKYFVVPETRREWWLEKISRNKELDAEHNRELKREGWRVITIFECRLKPKMRLKTLNRVITKITDNK